MTEEFIVDTGRKQPEGSGRVQTEHGHERREQEERENRESTWEPRGQEAKRPVAVG